jgi:hypothetical protein
MKLSHKILIGFFGSAFLYLSAAFVEVRMTGTPNVINDKNSIAETVDLAGVSFVIVNNLEGNIKVIGSDRAELEVRSFAGDALKKMKYTVSGDTLTLSGLESAEMGKVRISVFIPSTGLRGITVMSSVVAVQGLDQNHLQLSQDAGRIWMSESEISSLDMDLSNSSFLDINSSTLDTLSATIAHSEVHISSPVGLVQGSMNDASSMRLTDIREIKLKKDESSNLNMYR